MGSHLSGDAPEADGKKQAASLGESGLSRLKQHLAEGDGPTLDDFIAGGNDAAASPYSVYAPGFKVGHIRQSKRFSFCHTSAHNDRTPQGTGELCVDVTNSGLFAIASNGKGSLRSLGWTPAAVCKYFRLPRSAGEDQEAGLVEACAALR